LRWDWCCDQRFGSESGGAISLVKDRFTFVEVQAQAAEQAAANRLFGLLPPDQAQDFRALWDEFEAAETQDALFAKSLDRVQPVMANLMSGGGTWTEYNVTSDQLDSRVGT
jgi:putative hydrolase of HD superfamily